MMPASRATPSTSPLLRAGGDQRERLRRMTTRPRATATRAVAGLAEHRPSARRRRVEMGEVGHGSASGAQRLTRTSARAAAVTSGWRIRCSPTRKQRAPASAMRRTSPGVRMPISGRCGRPGSAAPALGGGEVGPKLRRLRLFTPISRVSRPSARSSSRRSCTSTSAAMSELATSSSSCAWSSERAARMSRMHRRPSRGIRRPARGRSGSPCAAPAARTRRGPASGSWRALEIGRVGQHGEAGAPPAA